MGEELTPILGLSESGVWVVPTATLTPGGLHEGRQELPQLLAQGVGDEQGQGIEAEQEVFHSLDSRLPICFPGLRLPS